MIQAEIIIDEETDLSKKRETYDRVTDILSPYSGMDKIPVQILEKAAERGTLVHKLCDQIIQGFEDIDIPEHVSGYMKSFASWNVSKTYCESPGRVYCDELKITGLCDCLYETDEGLVLVDFKTSAKEGLTWYLQGTAYAYLLRMKGYDICKVEFVQLDKNGKDAISHFYDEDFSEFYKCLQIYRLFFKKKEPESAIDYI